MPVCMCTVHVTKLWDVKPKGKKREKLMCVCAFFPEGKVQYVMAKNFGIRVSTLKFY